MKWIFILPNRILNTSLVETGIIALGYEKVNSTYIKLSESIEVKIKVFGRTYAIYYDKNSIDEFNKIKAYFSSL